MDDIRILSARRSYEFRVDDVRLTLLSNRGVVQHLQQAFGFETAGVGRPSPTFGYVQDTFPPGLVFDLGLAPVPDGPPTPIRFIHFEVARVVIDVAGPSSAIDPIFALVNDVLSGIRDAAGATALGSPIATRDFSQIRVRFPFDPKELIPRPVYSPIAGALAQLAEQQDSILVPNIQMRLASPTSEYLGGNVPEHETYTLDLRAGSPPNERIYLSMAPLETDAHLALLRSIEEAITPTGG